MKYLKLTLIPLITVALMFGLTGCQNLFGGDSSPADTTDGSSDYYDDSYYDDLNLDLNEANGGYDTRDEAPGFGDPAFLEIFAEAVPVDDNIADDPSVSEMEDDPEAMIHFLTIRWGQLQYNPDLEEVTDWGGSISVDRGAVIVLRKIRFENATDWIEPRDQITRVDLASLTRPHFDGLLLRIVDPDPAAGTPNMLTVQMGPATFSRDVALLDDYQELVDIDELGNQFSLQAPEILNCPNGFLNGAWFTRDIDERGVFRGGFVSYDGSVRGHVKGHWGINDEGEKVFFGKYIDWQGHFLGILRGTWEPDPTAPRPGTGVFNGHWFGTDDEPTGILGGHYRRGHKRGGYFGGRWVEECGL
jgi:hypothetical protein